MTTYKVTVVRNGGIYSSFLVRTENAKWITDTYHNVVSIKPATADDDKPGISIVVLK